MRERGALQRISRMRGKAGCVTRPSHMRAGRSAFPAAESCSGVQPYVRAESAMVRGCEDEFSRLT